jgi:hypothetical protein
MVYVTNANQNKQEQSVAFRTSTWTEQERPVNIQTLKELLDSARSSAYDASNAAESASSYASDAETQGNNVYEELDSIVDRLDDLVGFNPEVLRELRLVQKNLLKAAALAGKEMDRIVNGDGVEENKRWSFLNAILQKVFEYDNTYSEYKGFDESYDIEYDFGTGAYIVSRKKEENNG